MEIPVQVLACVRAGVWCAAEITLEDPYLVFDRGCGGGLFRYGVRDPLEPRPEVEISDDGRLEIRIEDGTRRAMEVQPGVLSDPRRLACRERL